MTKQEFILTFISVAIFLVLLVPTLIYKIRRERKLPTGEPVPVTQGQRFMALLGDAMWVACLRWQDGACSAAPHSGMSSTTSTKNQPSSRPFTPQAAHSC